MADSPPINHNATLVPNRIDYVYIIHVIVIGGPALAMLNTAIPSLLKYLILTTSTYAASNLTVYLCRKVIESKMQSTGVNYSNARDNNTANEGRLFRVAEKGSCP